MSFSTDELVHLAALLDLPPLPVLGPSPLDGLDDRARRYVLDAAGRSLVARGVIGADDGSVLPTIADLLEIVARPLVVGRAAVRTRFGVASTFHAAVADVTVEITPLVRGVHRLAPFATADLGVRLLGLAGLDGDRSVGIPVGTRVVVDEAAVERCATCLDGGDVGGAASALRGGGAPTEVVDALTGSGEPWTVATYALVHRPATERVEGGEVCVVDAGPGGVWSLDRVDGDGAATLAPTTVAAVAADLVELLPEV